MDGALRVTLTSRIKGVNVVPAKRVGRSAAILLASAVGLWTVGSPHRFTMPIEHEVVLPIAFFGPFNTAQNHGYESRAHIRPILPTSYGVHNYPRKVGIQFIGDAPANLRRHAFGLYVSFPGTPRRRLPIRVLPTGFLAADCLCHTPGPIRVTWQAPGFYSHGISWMMSYTYQNKGTTMPSKANGLRSGSCASALNAIRSRLHEMPVRWSSALEEAASAHVRYLKINGYQAPSFHEEVASRPSFVGKFAWTRSLFFGWPWMSTGEVGIESATRIPSAIAVQDFVDSVSHRLAVLSPNLLAVGAQQDTGHNGSLVMDLGYGYGSQLPYAVVYPSPGQTGVSTAWRDLEWPDPVLNGSGRQFGYPITVDFPTANQLRNAHGALFVGSDRVSIHWDSPNLRGLRSNQLAIVPRIATLPDTVYTVVIDVQAHFLDGHWRPVRLVWKYATGGSNQSVIAIPVSSHKVSVSVVRAGSGRPLPAIPVSLDYQKKDKMGWRTIAYGTSNAQGQVTIDLRQGLGPGRYQVITSQGNGGTFNWPLT